jgi:hypothetical protein
MRIPSRDLGGETNRAKNVAPDDRMQLSGLDGWGGKGVPPDETHHDQGETPGTPVPRVISSTAILSAKTTQTIESIG